MSFLILPTEIIVNNILIFLSLNDLIEFSNVCKITNNYFILYIKCNNCNSKIHENKCIYGLKECNKCKNIICKDCQTFCSNYEYCDNIFCDECLITELCSDCEDELQNSSNDEYY